jgi:hypothetical protein
MTKNDMNIFFSLEEKEDTKVEPDIFKLMNEFDSEYSKSYLEEYTIKELLKICNYYGIDKNIKSAKCKKQDIIYTLVYFESLPENAEIVQKRHELWNCIYILLNDPNMKKYVLWN